MAGIQGWSYYRGPGYVQPLGSKFRSEQLRFGEMLTRLQRQPVFQLHQFEVVMDSIRDCVAEVGVCLRLRRTGFVPLVRGSPVPLSNNSANRW